MNVLQLFPHRNYLLKLIVSALIGLVFTFGGIIVVLVASVIQRPEIFGLLTAGVIPFIGVILALFLLFIYAYYKSIRYEIHNDEIIVYSGFINKSVKHVNFRNITNMELKRTLFDRLLGIGSLSIQTAGSGTVTPEEKLAGLDNVQAIYQFLAQQLRDYRTESRPATTANSANEMNNRQISIQILRELRAIRGLLSQ